MKRPPTDENCRLTRNDFSVDPSPSSFEQDGRCSRKKGLVLKDNKLIFLPAGDKTIIGS